MDGCNIIGYKSSFVDQDIRWVMNRHEAGAIDIECGEIEIFVERDRFYLIFFQNECRDLFPK